MRNPLRSEAEAYRFVWGTIVYFAAIVVAGVINTWLGVAVFVVLTAAVGWLVFRRTAPEAPMTTASAQRSAPGERRILVIANETVGGSKLQACIASKSEGHQAHVLVVSPALNSPMRHWASDEDPARASAQERLDASLARLRNLGIEASGEVGDAEPLQAIEDALRTFGPDELIISTHPEGRSHWLEQGLVTKARERFVVPITHVVVDLQAEREEVR
jgi:nucleotide-binding universal stress UspA family protein